MGSRATKVLPVTQASVLKVDASGVLSPYASLQDKEIAYVSSSSYHSAIVSTSGHVFTFGKNEDFQLGLEEEDMKDMVAEPTLVRSLLSIPISQAACGLDFTFFLTTAGELFACGSNAYGQLGLGHKDPSHVPTRVTGVPTMRKVAAGMFHVVALTSNGAVWTSGFNSFGQLGLGHTVDQMCFMRLPDVCGPVIDVSCGGLHTALVSASGTLFVAGLNENGENAMIRFITQMPELSSLQPVSLPAAVASVVCGHAHNVVITGDGTPLSWGCNDSGQLGIGNKIDNFTPQKMIGLDNYNIAMVLAGGDHTAVITENGEVLICGKGRDGEFGPKNKDVEVANLVEKLEDVVVKQVAFSSTYTLLLIGPKQTPKQITVAITDSERSILSSLECPVCYLIMSAPIHLCTRGHSLCNTCQPSTKECPICRQPFTTARSYALESLSTEVSLPCVDCLERMPAQLLNTHSTVCPGRMYKCLAQKLCNWIGRPAALLAHVTSAHPNQTWQQLPRIFIHTDFEGNMQTNILAAFNEVFVLYRKYQTATKVFNAAIKFIGVAEKVQSYKFELEFIFGDNDTSLIFRNNVCVDTMSVEDMLKSDNCITLSRVQLDKCVQNKKLVCQASVVKACGARAEVVKALVCQ